MLKKIFFILFLSITTALIAKNNKDAENNLNLLTETATDSLFIIANQLKTQSIDNDDNQLEFLSDMYLARYYDRKGINNKAITHYLSSLEGFNQNEIYEYDAFILSRIAANYRFLKNYNKSEDYFYKALAKLDDSDLDLKAKLLNQLGDINRDMNKIDSAFHFYYESLEVAARKDTAAMANNYNNLGDLWRELNNYDSSSYYYNLSASLLKNSTDVAELAENYTSLALLNFNEGKKNEAIDYITKSINLLENTSSYELNNAYEAAIKIFSKTQMLDSLTKYLFKLNSLEKQLSQEKLISSLRAIELEQNLKGKEAENILLKRENEIQNLTNLLLIALSVSALIIGGFLFAQIKRKKSENKILFEQNEKINKANNELKEAYENIQELNDTKDKLFSIISHDLKGPVTSMKLLLDEIVKDIKTFSKEELQDIMNEFSDSTANTLDLLHSLLDWSRSQRNLIQLDFEKIQLNKLSKSNINLFERIAADKYIQISDEIPEDLYANIDYNTINTVFRNLISNAIKFTPKNGKIIIGHKSISENEVEIFIKDSGTGIPEDIQKGLFKVGENKSTPGTNDEKGTGLGLLLCKDFVEKNGGKIRFETQEGIGTTFFFTLPIKR